MQPLVCLCLHQHLQLIKVTAKLAQAWLLQLQLLREAGTCMHVGAQGWVMCRLTVACAHAWCC